MAITTLDQYVASTKQVIPITKTASRTTIEANWFSLFDLAGNPGAGTLNVGNTANGLVPTCTVAGFPIINAFGGSAGYLSIVDYGCSVAGRLAIYDRLFHAGAYAYNAAVSLASQPSYSGRVPGGTDFTGLQIWVECVTGFTGNQSIAVTYTNQSGVTGRTTGTIATGVAPTLGRMIQLPLQAGDSGVQKIESVTGTVATVGTFNVLVLRPLWSGRVRIANDGDVHGLDKTGMPVVFATSALFLASCADSTASGVPDMQLEIVNG